MAVTIRLKDFTVKPTPVAADIVYLGDSADSFNEVQVTVQSLLLAIPGASQIWSVVSGTTQAAAVDHGYIIGNAAQTTVTLPATAPVGSRVSIAGQGAAGWILAPNVGQTIKLVTVSAGTSVTSAEQYDCIDVICVVANTTWVATNMVTTGFTYV